MSNHLIDVPLFKVRGEGLVVQYLHPQTKENILFYKLLFTMEWLYSLINDWIYMNPSRGKC